MLLDGGRRPGVGPDVGRHVQRRDRREHQAPRLAPRQELPHGPPVRRARPRVRDPRREELQEALDGRRPGVDDHRGQHDGPAGPGDLGPGDRWHQGLAHSDTSPLPTSVSKRS